MAEPAGGLAGRMYILNRAGERVMNNLAKRSINSPDLSRAASTLQKSVWHQLNGLKRSLAGELVTKVPKKQPGAKQGKQAKKTK
ncbi:hypothetical protein BwSF12_43880 [Bradyrhizobium ottawaense]|nr:hypothetical protein BwSF21_32290 [Bradyrhizobium ottawaense]GMO41036.1 hypothetical protein BwSF12_43880 [Bradyrhizobium ottawaense]GMO54133.1 hypothetical protein BwSG20_00450 [Bradyrhizobium ottawaense]GMO76451.1 hypothetical protein BwSH17_43020 [Bradyrhizobium ottawaense]GMO84532.1 hypothetical protein BwSF19_41510 [Bradyrhizobium ottawaense]